MRIVLMIAVLGLAACQPTTSPVVEPRPVAASGQIASPAGNMASPAGNMASLLNSARAGQGRGPITENARLSRAARDHAQDMVSGDYFSHTGRNGSSFSQRARAAGYACAAAENIAFGQQSEAEVVNEWMNSSGHRRNILLADASEYGIGRVGNMWVLMLGRGC